MEAKQLEFKFVNFSCPPTSDLPEQKLQLLISKLYNAPWIKIAGKSRKPELVKARFLYSHFAHLVIYKTLKEIGAQLNGRHHSTVINGIHQVSDHLNSKDPAYDEFRQKYQLIQQFITTQITQNDFHYRNSSCRAPLVRHSKTSTIQKH